MRKLVHHKNILQLLDWNSTEGENYLYTDCYYPARMSPSLNLFPVLQYSWFKTINEGRWNLNHSVSPIPYLPSAFICAEPYILIMEYVSYGTLRTFLQTNRAHLSGDPELQSLLTIASYHIALAMQHLRSKMVQSTTALYEVHSCRFKKNYLVCSKINIQ